MRILKKLIPQFLIEIDKDWQHKYPRLWSTRVHYHIWFVLLLNVLAFALGMILGVELWSFPSPEGLFGFLVLPIIFYFAFWVYKVVLFSVEKRFGKSNWKEAIWEFAVMFFSIALILTIPYTLSLTVAWRAGSQISHEQLASDVDFLNEWSYVMHSSGGFHKDEHNYEPLYNGNQTNKSFAYEGAYYRSDMHRYFRSIDEYVRRDSTRRPSDPEPLNDTYRELYEQYNQERAQPIDTRSAETIAYYSKELTSIENTGMYLLVELDHFTPRTYSMPDWDVFDIDNHKNHTYSGSIHLFKPYVTLQKEYIEKIRQHVLPSKEQLQRIIELNAKYREAPIPLTPDYLLKAHDNRRSMRSSPLNISQSIENIWEAKEYDYDFMEPEFIILFLINLVFVLTILVSIFKQVHWQPFLLSFVVSAILPIILLIAVLIFTSQTDGIREADAFAFLYTLLFIFIVASLFGIKKNLRYSTVSSILTILGNVLLPFFLLYMVVVLEDAFDIFNIEQLQDAMREAVHNSSRYHELDAMRDLQKARFNTALAFTWIAGLVGYWVLGHAWMRSLHKHILGLPEKK